MLKLKSCTDHVSLAGALTGRVVAYPNIEAILDDGGDITVGRLDRSIGKAWENETIIDEVNG
jgi:hypothetical protein